MAPQLAYLGMGSMGQAMTKNLVAKGNLEHPIILYNRTQSLAESHSAAIGHSVVVPSVEEAVSRADIVWSCLASEQAVVETFDRILKTDVKSKLFLECSTIPSETTEDLARRVIEAGGEFVAMPVFGEPSMANAGILTCLPAGAAESVQRIKPYLVGVIARSIIDLSGEKPSTATHLKLMGNVLIIQMIEAVGESHVLAEKTGLASKHLQNLIKIFWPGPYSIYSERMASGDYYKKEPIVKLDMAQDVASHVLRLAQDSGTSLEGYKVGSRHLEAARNHPGHCDDVSGIYGAIRVESGLEFENQKLQEPVVNHDLAQKVASHESTIPLEDSNVNSEHLEASKSHQEPSNDISNPHSAIPAESGLEIDTRKLQEPVVKHAAQEAASQESTAPLEDYNINNEHLEAAKSHQEPRNDISSSDGATPTRNGLEVETQDLQEPVAKHDVVDEVAPQESAAPLEDGNANSEHLEVARSP